MLEITVRRVQIFSDFQECERVHLTSLLLSGTVGPRQLLSEPVLTGLHFLGCRSILHTYLYNSFCLELPERMPDAARARQPGGVQARGVYLRN